LGRWFYGLIVLSPVAFIARTVALPDLLVFLLAAVSLIPLAGLIGRATEELAHHLGPRAGGLLNATFGNAAELIITLFAIHRGLLTLVKASITGAIIGNTLFILGMSLLVGGLRYKKQRFDAQDTSLNAAMMILAIAGLYLPATFAFTVRDPAIVENLSLLVAGVLLVTYGAYLAYVVLQGGPAAVPVAPTGDPPSPAGGEGRVRGSDLAAEVPPHADPRPEGEGTRWSTRRSLAVLGGATVGAAVSSEVLVSAVEPVSGQFGLSEFFVGAVVVALVGNAAEHFSAVQMAWRNRLDVSLAITAGSSTQIALFVAPLLVFASILLGHPMDLIFVPLELAILGVATALFAYISVDGESNWLEGVQLLAIYLIAGFAFFLVPIQHP